MINPTLSRVTQRITHRSQASRAAYLARIEAARSQTVHRAQLACGNLAHGFAACQPDDKTALKTWCAAISPSSPPTTTCCRPTSRTNTTRSG